MRNQAPNTAGISRDLLVKYPKLYCKLVLHENASQLRRTYDCQQLATNDMSFHTPYTGGRRWGLMSINHLTTSQGNIGITCCGK